jgi:hypothetical protein
MNSSGIVRAAATPASMSAADKEALRRFYHSGGTSFAAFKGALDKQASRKDTPAPVATPGGPADATQVSADATPIVPPGPVAAGTPLVGIGALRALSTSLAVPAAQKKASAAQPKTDAASPEYLEFLRAQQSVQHQRATIENVLTEMAHSRRDRQAQMQALRAQVAGTLREVEDVASWKLRSKYDEKQLARDCGLSLQQQELTPDSAPSLAAIDAARAQLVQLKAERESGDRAQVAAFAPHALFVEQAARRLELIASMLADGNSDSAPLLRAAESMLVQLQTVCVLPSVEAVVTPFVDEIEKAAFRLEKARAERNVAISDGEVQAAERLCYEVVDEHEHMLTSLLAKLTALRDGKEEVSAMDNARMQFSKQAAADLDGLREQAGKLRRRCEDDIQKMFALREKVEEVETQTATRVKEETERSNEFLAENSRKLELAFARMEELEREIDVLEKERHREFMKRLNDKDKNEHRKAEYAHFCATVDTHLAPLERTVKNMILIGSATDALEQLVSTGFKQIADNLHEREELVDLATLEAHKQHVEALRGLLLEVGDIVQKKERMIGETDRGIQQAHVQQELHAETFNPNAKKFGDIKRKLLASRGELEQDVLELKSRAEDALQRFASTEDALNAAGVPFVHPVVEQEQHALEVKAKLVEYKAMAIGHVEGSALLEDVAAFKAQLEQTKREISAVNVSTTGAVGRTLPVVRAAQNSRLS